MMDDSSLHNQGTDNQWSPLRTSNTNDQKEHFNFKGSLSKSEAVVNAQKYATAGIFTLKKYSTMRWPLGQVTANPWLSVPHISMQEDLQNISFSFQLWMHFVWQQYSWRYINKQYVLPLVGKYLRYWISTKGMLENTVLLIWNAD